MSRVEFRDDPSVECFECMSDINPGEDYLFFDDHAFCGEDCIGKYMVDKCADLIISCHVDSAYDKECEYDDMLCDERMDRENF